MENITPAEWATRITEELRDALEYAHTQRSIAEEMGVSHVTVGNLLRGTQQMTVQQMMQLAEVAGLSPEDLFRAAFEGWVQQRKPDAVAS